jgi:hypothetical protein
MENKILSLNEIKQEKTLKSNKFISLKVELKKEIFEYFNIIELYKFGFNTCSQFLKIIKNSKQFSEIKEKLNSKFLLNNDEINDILYYKIKPEKISLEAEYYYYYKLFKQITVLKIPKIFKHLKYDVMNYITQEIGSISKILNTIVLHLYHNNEMGTLMVEY